MQAKLVDKRCFLLGLGFAALMTVDALSGGEYVRDKNGKRWPKNLTSAVQHELTERGYDPGPVDGVYGPKTERAIRAFQAASGLPEDGMISQELLEALGYEIVS